MAAGKAPAAGAAAPPLVLRVAEALPKDAGRGVARLDPEDIDRLGARIGDVVTVTGTRMTALKVLPTYPEFRGQSLVQMDGIARENAGVGLDERVTVAVTAVGDARSLTLAPLGPSRLTREALDARYVGRLMDGLVAQQGDRVRVNLFGARPQDFTVVETTPRGPVLVASGTRIRITGAAPPERLAAEKVAYEDIGGLGRKLQRIREMIELPLRFPEVFERLGIEPPRGVLLYGPPGCGKTLIARAVANETSAHFLQIAGPEVVHKFYGESEAHLRRLFDEAQAHTPSIVFLDEIDAIAPRRTEVQGEVEKRMVAQLLALMDGLKSRGNVVVIAATNLPDQLDPALRRPGRFDREIEIDIPDRTGRREILEVHTRGMPLADDVDLDELAGSTHGFVGADLEALCREAAMSALRRLLPGIDLAAAEISMGELMALQVTMDDFADALREVGPSALREVFVEVADVSWDDVGGLEEAKEALREAVEWPLLYAPVFARLHAQPAKGILLSGPPGSGKTLLAKVVARECGVNFLSVKGPELMSRWVGASEEGVRKVFAKARQAAPCIVFLDEIESLAPRRGYGGSESHVSERVVSQLLTEMDGIEELRGVVVLAATNRPDLVDEALRRPGRFDIEIAIGEPDRAARRAILEVHTRRPPLAPDVDLDDLAERTAGMVGADLQGLCRDATMRAARAYVTAGGTGAADLEELVVTAEHFEAALEARKAAKGHG